jgi:hypothetical protein
VIFNVQAMPGRRAGAAFTESQPGRPLLLLDLDPVRVWVGVPPVAEGPRVLAAFLRELAREAGRMAERVEEYVPPESVTESQRASGKPVGGVLPRHAYRRTELEGDPS